MRKLSVTLAVIPRLALQRARAGVLILPLLIAGCAMHETTNFDSAAWKSQRGAKPLDNQRGAMVPALANLISEGMPRADVIGVLGEPDSSDAAKGVDVYELGVSDAGIDEEYYEVRYQDGRVASRRWSRR